MFNCSIEKSLKYDCIEIFIPVNCVYNDILVLISHGSGGVGSAEYATADFFLKQGYTVGINNYFSKHNIKELYWTYDPPHHPSDEYDVSFLEMFTNVDFPDYKIIHIGFSLGGSFGLFNANRFVKNYNFYPGILGITSKLAETDYSNSTTFLAGNDNWCNDAYYNFEQIALSPPKTILFNDAYHGFMIPNKNRPIYIAKYDFPKRIMKDYQFAQLKPNHCELAKKYSFTMTNILLQSNEKCSTIALELISKELNDSTNTISRT